MNKLTSRNGLTPLTTVFTLTIVMLLAILTSLYILADSPRNNPNSFYNILTPQLPKVESVALGNDLNEILINVRTAMSAEIRDVRVYLIKGGSLRDVPITNVVVERIDNLLLVRVTLCSNIDRGEYLMKVIIGNKNSEVKFTV